MNRLVRFIRQLPAGDTLVAGALSLLLLIACFAGFTSLLRAFQETIPARGGTLTEGSVGIPRFVNPLLAISDSDKELVQLTYAGLMGHSADGSLIPVLASSYTVSPDGLTYTFTLRKDAVWQDGIPVTADDVVYTIQKVQDPALKSPSYANWTNVRVEARDAQTVTFTLSKPYVPFLEDTTLGILPKHIWQRISDEEFLFDSHTTFPIGSGPYTVKSISHDSTGSITGYTLEANKTYMLGEPYISHIHLKFYKSQDDVDAAFKKGSIKSAFGIPTPSSITVPYARIFGVFFNSDINPALKDKDVRKALSLAVDRTTLTKEILGGYATPLTGPLPAGASIIPIPLPSDDTRLSEARGSLDEAGYTYATSTNTWSKSGKELSITLTTSNVPELRAVSAQIQKDWQTLGVPVQLEFHEPTNLTQTVIRPRTYSALLFGEVIGTTPDLYAFWNSTERTGSGLNIANYNNPAVDTLLTQYRAQSDPEMRAETLSKIQSVIAEDYPAIFLYTPTFVYNAQENIHGIRLSQVSSPSDRFWGVQDWYRYTEHVWPIFVPDARSGTHQ